MSPIPPATDGAGPESGAPYEPEGLQPDSAYLPDLERPWLGLESFREETRAYLFGRDREIGELHLRLRGHPLLVLYGRSGLGKTSILTAGLIPRLRSEGKRPLLVRLRYDDPTLDPASQLVAAVFGWGERHGVQLRLSPRPTKSVPWVRRISQTLGIQLPEDPPSRLWLRLHHRGDPTTITHLILDQFEEVFTLGEQVPGAEIRVRDAMAILLQGAIPEPISQLIAEHDGFLDAFDPDSVPVRAILALRDDYVYALNRWRRHLPALGQNTFELRALRGPAAFDAVFKPGVLRCHYHAEISDAHWGETGLPPIIDTDTAARIVRFIAGKPPDVSMEDIEAVPPILSLLCHELNERRFVAPSGTADTPAERITFRETEADIETIIAAFYERCLRGRPEAVRIFIEEELVSYSGARLAQDEASLLRVFEHGCDIPGAPEDRRAAGFGESQAARACLDELISQRLLSPLGDKRHELIHDLIAMVVEKSRLARAERLRTEEAERKAEQARKAKQAGEEQARREQAQADRLLQLSRRNVKVVTGLLSLAVVMAGFAVFGLVRARSAATALKGELALSAFREAVERTSRGDSAGAIAFAARSLRVSAEDSGARALSIDLLVNRVWPAVTVVHKDQVTAVAWSPDGTRVLTGSWDKTARVWDARTGQPVGAPLAHQDSVTAVAWSPDGTRVLTGSWDKTTRVWDARTGQPVGAPLAHQDSVTAVAWSPDGTRVLTGSTDKTARVWDARTGQPVGAPLAHQDSVTAVAWSPDGTRVLTGSTDKTARVWDARTGQPVGAPLAHQDRVWAVVWSPDGTRVLTGSRDHTARVWDARTGQPVGAPLAHQDSVTAVAWSPDGTRVLTGSGDHTARVWDARTGQPVGAPLAHQGTVTAVAWSPDGTRVLTGSTDKTARVWDARTGQPVGAPLAHQDWVQAVAWSLDGTRVLTGSTDTTARVWDARTGQPVGAPLAHQDSVTAVAWSPDGTRVLTGSFDTTARVWDARTGQPVGAPLAHQDRVWAVAWSPDGTRVLTGSRDHTARAWDARTGQPVGAPLAHQDSVTAVAWSSDGTRVLTGSTDHTARVWDARTGQPVGAPLAHQDSVTAVAWSPDGTRVLTGSWDKTARVWDARTGQPVGAPLAHQDWVQAVAWSPDGTRVLTGSEDKTARVWDARTGQPVGAPLAHQDSVTAVAWSSDGTRVLTGSGDHTARVWDARTGQPVGAPLAHQDRVTAVAWSPDGTRVLTGSDDKTARVWDAPVLDRADADRMGRAAELTSGLRVNEQGSLEPLDDASRLEQLAALTKEVAAQKAEPGSLGETLRWVLAPARERTISPLSRMSVEEYVRRMLALGADGRAEVERTFPGHPLLRWEAEHGSSQQ